MKLALYAHPFDIEALDRHGGLRRIADLGISEVALAVSYHDGRWLQPWNPQTRVRFLEDGTVHFRPGDLAAYGELSPLTSTSVLPVGPTPLERLCRAAPAAGLAVRAWAVFTHNTRLGSRHPELCVENAFGDRYVYALCPAQPPVQQYVLAMLRDLKAHDGLSSIELEAVGWMGWKHGSHHDKASFQPKGALAYALSLCFCTRCQAAAAAAGGDPDRLREQARELCVEQLERGDAMAGAPEVDVDDRFSALARGRIETMRTFGGRIGQLLGDGLAVQVHPAPDFTGSQLPAVQAGGFAADEFVITAYGEGPGAIGRLLADEHLAAIGPRRLSIWPRSPHFTSDEDLVKVRELAADHGIETVAIYHLGLLPWRTIERVAGILAT